VLVERGVERLGLGPCPREPVEDPAAGGVGLLETVEEHADDRVVRHELPAAHVAIRLPPHGGAGGNRRAQEVARREMRQPELRLQQLRLGALPRPGRSEEHQDRHGRAALRADGRSSPRTRRPAVAGLIG
jgi:hypothetical protein